MAFKHGKSTAVYMNAIDLSPYLTTAGLSLTLGEADSTTFAATWKSSIGGVPESAVTLDGYHDVDQSTVSTLFLTAAPGVLTYCPAGGAAIGDRARLVSAIDSSWSTSSPVGGLVGFSAGVTGTAAVGFGDIVHPLGVDTGTTTGSSKDETASTSTGWTAHLHVTAVSSGSWVVTIEDSSTGSSGWALVSGATFAAATVPTSERLAAATVTATVKQYIRYVATVTGGSSPTITFTLAFARNV